MNSAKAAWGKQEGIWHHVGLALERAATALLIPRPCVLNQDLSSGSGVLGSAHCSGRAGLWRGRGEKTLPSRGWRWHSQGLAGRAGDLQPQPSPKEQFGINFVKVEEGSSPQPHFVDPVSETCRCCLNLVPAGSLGCDLCLGHKDPSSFSSQLMLLP